MSKSFWKIKSERKLYDLPKKLNSRNVKTDHTK